MKRSTLGALQSHGLKPVAILVRPYGTGIGGRSAPRQGRTRIASGFNPWPRAGFEGSPPYHPWHQAGSIP